MDLNQIRQQLIVETKKLYIPKFEVVDIAPSTLKDVSNAYKLTGKLYVWSGASQNTIWGDVKSNYLFRAWHDYAHILVNGEFNRQGETLACYKQMSQVGTQFGKIIQFEVLGQLSYFETHGHFPQNQVDYFKKSFKF